MYVCIYTYKYVHIFTYVYKYIYTQVLTHKHTHAHKPNFVHTILPTRVKCVPLKVIYMMLAHISNASHLQ